MCGSLCYYMVAAVAVSASFLPSTLCSMPDGDTSNGQSGAVAPPSSTFHQTTPPKYLDLKHSGEIAENWKLLEGEI